MAINTGGFQAQVMPSVQFADPRVYSEGLANLMPSIQHGVGLQSALTNLALQKHALEREKFLEPIQSALLQAQLGEAQKQAAIPRELINNVTPIDETKVYPSATDDEGNPTGPADVEWGNLYKLEQGVRIGRGGLIEPFERKVLIKDAKTREAESAKLSAETDYKTQLGEAALGRAQALKDRADAMRELNAVRAQHYQDMAEVWKERVENGRYKPINVVLPNGNQGVQWFDTRTGQAAVPPNPSDFGLGDRAMGGGTVLPPAAPVDLGGKPISGAKKSGSSFSDFLEKNKLASGLNSGLANVGPPTGTVPVRQAPAAQSSQFVVGKVYVDGRGNRAKYLGGDTNNPSSWQSVESQ